MKNGNLDGLLKKVARRNNTTPENVRREMEDAIELMMNEQDESKRQNRISLLGHDGRPTVEELLMAIANAAKSKGAK